MNTNQRFAISIHALTLLAANSTPLTSEMIAGSVDTNPVVIRRTMAGLRQRGLVESKSGAHGGWKLLRDPKQILLCDVYLSLGEDTVLAIHAHPNKYCPVGGNIKGTLQEIFSVTQNAMIDSLRQVTFADVLADVRAKGKK